MPSRPLLVLSLEGLATSALSCYGCSWNHTETIDQIAANGCVWDRWLTAKDDPLEPLKTLLTGQTGWQSSWQAAGELELLTDVESIADTADSFDQVTLVPLANELQGHREPAAELEDTHFASLVAQAVQRDAATSGDWSLMWIHSSFLTRQWDSPESLLELGLIGLDQNTDFVEDAAAEEVVDLHLSQAVRPLPDRMPGIEVPRIELAQLQSNDSRADDFLHPDLIAAWMRTYACQVQLIDVLLRYLLDAFTQHWETGRPSTDPLHQGPQVMIMGTSGFSLGQNGWIGHGVGPLRSAEIRLPLILGSTGPIRIPHTTIDRQLPAILKQLGNGLPPATPECWVRLESDSEPPVEIESHRAQKVVHTDQWLYVRDLDHQEALFLKPDDVDDVNDVSRLRPDLLETFE